MLISIITPSYNQAAFLEETMLSVLRQDYAKIEYIVIDGGSTDGSQKIVQKYEGKLAHWISEKDSGQVDAIMKGFRKATGDVLAWVNSDDLLAPSAVRIATDYLTAYPSVGLVYGDRLHIDAKGNVIGINQGPSFYAQMLSRDITIPQETTFFRRTFFEKVGGLDQDLHFSMDFDLWCKLQKITIFKHAPAFLGSYREHACSKSIILNEQTGEVSSKFKREQQLVFKRHFGRELPGKSSVRWYRLLHKVKFLRESQTRSYCEERARIRRLIEQP